VTGTLIECTSADNSVRRQFLVTTSAIVDAFGAAPVESDIADALEILIELFRLMAAAPKTSIQGLWGELFVMASGREPETLADSWHVTAGDHHDFACASQRIEVKTAGGRHRRHRFSFDQPDVGDETELFIVSLQAEPSAAGATVRDLVADVCARVGRHARLAVLRGVADALGADWEQADRHRYDTAGAFRSLKYYDHRHVPRPLDVPDGVTDVRFTADLAHVPHTQLATIVAAGGLLAASAPGFPSPERAPR